MDEVMKMVLAHKCCYTSFSYAQIIHAGLSVNLHYEPLIKNKTDDVELLMADPDSLVSQTRVVTDNSDVSRMWKGWSLWKLELFLSDSHLSPPFSFFLSDSLCAPNLGRKSSRSDLERLKGGPCGSSGAKTTCLYNFIYTL